jgi:hypothetical protein
VAATQADRAKSPDSRGNCDEKSTRRRIIVTFREMLRWDAPFDRVRAEAALHAICSLLV